MVTSRKRGTHSLALYVLVPALPNLNKYSLNYVNMHACVCAYVCAYSHVCVCACMSACMH